MPCIILYGGTFDPIHKGHISIATAVSQLIPNDGIHFLPCKKPVLKQETQTTTENRVAMLKLALEAYPSFSIDYREIERDTPSYMVDTLKSLHQENTDRHLILLIGMDAFNSLPQWHDYLSLFDYANILVVNRAGTARQLNEKLQALIKARLIPYQQLHQHKQGKITFIELDEIPVSSTEVRNRLKNSHRINDLVPDKIAAYITKHDLY